MAATAIASADALAGEYDRSRSLGTRVWVELSGFPIWQNSRNFSFSAEDFGLSGQRALLSGCGFTALVAGRNYLVYSFPERMRLLRNRYGVRATERKKRHGRANHHAAATVEEGDWWRNQGGSADQSLISFGISHNWERSPDLRTTSVAIMAPMTQFLNAVAAEQHQVAQIPHACSY